MKLILHIPFLILVLISIDGFAADKNQTCLKEGETASIGGVPDSDGWKLKLKCCVGLSDIESLDVCGKGSGGGYNYVCTNCGDGLCNEKYESSCNCPKDCGAGQIYIKNKLLKDN